MEYIELEAEINALKELQKSIKLYIKEIDCKTK